MRYSEIRRRDVLVVLRGAAAWPLAARAQQPAMPVIGFLHPGTTETATRDVAAFRKGLNEAGYTEGQNVTVEYHWLEGHYDRLPTVIDGTDLMDVHHHVGVYTGSILKGAKPADLPVMQSTKFEFSINLQAARALGIEVPPGMLSIADDVIE
jgi:ABC transporter substrate binding protein